MGLARFPVLHTRLVEEGGNCPRRANPYCYQLVALGSPVQPLTHRDSPTSSIKNLCCPTAVSIHRPALTPQGPHHHVGRGDVLGLGTVGHVNGLGPRPNGVARKRRPHSHGP